jgi:KDO2-lipid IV(A) lauroyltransferase
MHHGRRGGAPLKRKRDHGATALRRLGWRAECLGIRAVLGAAGLLPAGAADWIARTAGGWVGGLAPARRAVLEENLRRALGQEAAPRLGRLIKAIHRNALTMVFELGRLGRLSAGELRASVECAPVTDALLDRIAKEGKGAVLMTAHIGNWEQGASWVAQRLGRPFGIVYKPLHNPLADALLLERRKRLGLLPHSTRERSQRGLVAFLKQGGIVGILPDQDAGRRGEFIPFFGAPASTTTAFAKLAARLGLEAYFVHVARVEPGRFRIRAERLESPEAGIDRDEAARRIMLDYHRKLEQAILEAPEQYFWWHRRWRTRPKRAKGLPKDQ